MSEQGFVVVESKREIGWVLDQDAWNIPEYSRQIFAQAGRQRKTTYALESGRSLSSLSSMSGKERD